jgi:autotransporter-associated beta strand protein
MFLMRQTVLAVMSLGVILVAFAGASPAATITMNASDAINTSSFNSGLHWNGGAAPTTGNAYQTVSFLLRSPTNQAPVAFAGDSLEIQAGGEFRLKTAAMVTVANLTFDGGSSNTLTAPVGGNLATLAGNITLNGIVNFRSGIQASENVDVLTNAALLSGAGGFNTTGSFGTIVFTGTNGFTGGATVNGGTVLVNGIFSGSGVTVSSGTLGGNGVIKGAVTCQAAGTVQPGLGGTDTSALVVSNTLNLAGTNLLVVNRSGTPNASRISGITTLTEGGVLVVTNAGAALQIGDSFTLFSASVYAGSFSTVTLPALSGGLTWNNNLAANGSITVAAASTARWTNDASSVWSAATNWLNGNVANGTDSTADFSSIHITADRTVTLDASRSIGNLIFGNTSGAQNWSLNASGGSVLTLAVSSGAPVITVTNNSASIGLSLAGTSGLTKSGAGTLILNGVNSYTGTTTVNAGAMSIAGPAGSSAGLFIIGTSANAVVNILPGATFSAYNLALGEGPAAAGAVFQSGGTLTQSQGASVADFRIGDATSAYGYYQLSGGTLNVNEIGVGGGNGGSATVGVLDVTGGTLNNAGWITIGRGGTTSSGAVNVSGNTVVTLPGTVGGSHIGLNWGGGLGALSLLNIFNGGSVAGPASTAYYLDLSVSGGAGSAGVVNLNSGGTLAIGAVTASGAGSTSLLNFNGGVLKATTANASFLTSANIKGIYAFANGATIDDGGNAITVSVPLLAPTEYGVSSIALVNGGSNYIGAPLVSINGGSGTGATALAQVNFSTGQVTNLLITSAGSGYTASDSLTVTFTGGGGNGASAGTVSFVPNVSGGLTKAGAGTLTLGGANTFTGKTTVSNGTLLLTGTLSGDAVVAGGGTLMGNGSIGGALTNQAGGSLQPGFGGGDTSTLAAGNNVVLAGTNNFALNRVNVQSSSRINAAGTVTLGGTLNVTNAGAPLQAADRFTLFNAAGFTGNFSTVNLPALDYGLAWSNTIPQNGTLSIVSFLPPTNAVVTNLPASQIFATSATLNGQVLSSGGQAPNIWIYYGPNDGGTNSAAWSNAIVVGVKNAAFSAIATALATNTIYYFTALASNSAGIAWASPSQNFTTLAANPFATRVPMLTYHNDNTRQGQNPNETLLTPTNVNTNTFGKLFSYAVDGYVYTEPLIMTNVAIPGQGVHNVVFIATEHDTVYAFDADSNAGANGGLLWKTNLGTAALNAISPYGRRYTGTSPYSDITPEVGATGTPVIDPVSGTLYVNAFTREIAGNVTNFVHRIHALDVTTGRERSYSPVVVAGSVPGVGVDSAGGVMTFNPMQNNQRPALTLAGGRLFVAYAGYADTDPYHGWLFAYNATNLALQTNYIFNSTPNATTSAFGAHAAEGGVWQGGGGLCVDTNNNLFFETGNGSFSANTNGGDYADTFLKLSTTNGLVIADYFTPYNQASLAAADTDLGSCGPLLLPDAAGSAAHPHLLAGLGKSGKMYLLDRDAMASPHYQAGSDSQIVQSFTATPSGIWSPPTYFNGSIYVQPSSGPMRQFSIANAAVNTTPVATAPASFGIFNGGPVVSANGTNNGIVWVLNSAAFGSSGPAVLYAYNATNISQMLYNSSQLAARDNPGGAVKMTTPTVAGGKVYVPAQYTLSVFGVQVFLDAPSLSPNGGNFVNAVNVAISDASAGASIYYTLDGTTPTAGSTLYTAPFTLTSNAVVHAVAIEAGAVNSAVASASFVNTAASGNGVGLTGEYFANATSASPFSGPPALVQTNATVNFSLTTNWPGALVGSNQFTVRWTGSVQPQFTEKYSFITTADDGVRLYLNGQLLIDDWVDKTNATGKTNSIALVAQQFYTVELDYYQVTNDASVTLSWSSPSTPLNVVPQTQLYPFTNPPPTVIITAPTNGAIYTASASVTVSADADAPNNPISSVGFYANSAYLGSLSNLPYALTATGLGAGNYTLTAVATDGSGVSSTSAPVNITVVAGGGLAYGLTSNATVNPFLNLPTNINGALPAHLSGTGVYSNTTSRIPAAGLIPYAPIAPLWKDNAASSWLMAIPNDGGVITPGEQIQFQPTNAWAFPTGSVFVKNFDLVVNETNAGVPPRRLETQLLVRDNNGSVYGVTYKWRPDNSDADLLASSLSENILITNAAGVRTQTWYYPSPADCQECHNTAVAGNTSGIGVLGVNARQLNGNLTYAASGVTDNQLRTLNRLGLFNPAFNESDINGFARLSAMTNLSASLQERVRSYLDANCEQCHQPGGQGITWDARYDTPLAQQNITNFPAAFPLGISDGACIVKAKDAWRSVLLARINTTNQDIQMPDFRNLIDTNAVQVITDWINSLPGTPAEAPPGIAPDGGSYFNGVGVTLTAPDTNAVIYYTLDGTLPTTNSLAYAGAFNVTSNATVAASAWRTNYNNSVASSALFFVTPLYFTTAGFVTNHQFQLNFLGAPGSNYVLQATTNLTAWIPISTNTVMTNPLILFDANATNFRYRFYRVLQQ